MQLWQPCTLAVRTRQVLPWEQSGLVVHTGGPDLGYRRHLGCDVHDAQRLLILWHSRCVTCAGKPGQALAQVQAQGRAQQAGLLSACGAGAPRMVAAPRGWASGGHQHRPHCVLPALVAVRFSLPPHWCKQSEREHERAWLGLATRGAATASTKRRLPLPAGPRRPVETGRSGRTACMPGKAMQQDLQARRLSTSLT